MKQAGKKGSTEMTKRDAFRFSVANAELEVPVTTKATDLLNDASLWTNNASELIYCALDRMEECERDEVPADRGTKALLYSAAYLLSMADAATNAAHMAESRALMHAEVRS